MLRHLKAVRRTYNLSGERFQSYAFQVFGTTPATPIDILNPLMLIP
jgi:hypothetical protein